MEPFKVNIATFDYYNERATKWITGCFVIIIVMAVLLNLTLYLGKKGTIEDYQHKIESLKTVISKKDKQLKERNPELSENEKEMLKTQMEFVNRVILRDVFPWPKALDSIERNLPKGVVLESIIYSGNPGEIILKGDALSTGDVALFLDGLNNEGGFNKNVLSILSIGPQKSNSRPDEVIVTFEISSKLNFQRFLPGTHFTND